MAVKKFSWGNFWSKKKDFHKILCGMWNLLELWCLANDLVGISELSMIINASLPYKNLQKHWLFSVFYICH